MGIDKLRSQPSEEIIIYIANPSSFICDTLGSGKEITLWLMKPFLGGGGEKNPWVIYHTDLTPEDKNLYLKTALLV